MTSASELDDAVRRVLAQTKLATKLPPHDKFRNWLAVFIVNSFVATLIFLIFHEIPDKNKDTITYILGQISGMATTVLSFYFVSSAAQGRLDEKRADNTAKVVDLATEALKNTSSTEPQPVRVEQPLDQPVPTQDVGEKP